MTRKNSKLIEAIDDALLENQRWYQRHNAQPNTVPKSTEVLAYEMARAGYTSGDTFQFCSCNLIVLRAYQSGREARAMQKCDTELIGSAVPPPLVKPKASPQIDTDEFLSEGFRTLPTRGKG